MGKLDGSERVLCVPSRGVYRRIPKWLCGHMQAVETLDELLLDGRFEPRTEALESDPSKLQCVSYGVLTCRGLIFAHRRHKSGTERRLHGKASLGVGGHVNEADRATFGAGGLSLATIQNGLRRELAEELALRCGYSTHLAGLLFDDSNPVGQVHLGVVFQVKLASEAMAPVPEIEPLGWFSPATLIEVKGMPWESWSGLLVDHWLPSLASAVHTPMMG